MNEIRILSLKFRIQSSGSPEVRNIYCKTLRDAIIHSTYTDLSTWSRVVLLALGLVLRSSTTYKILQISKWPRTNMKIWIKNRGAPGTTQSSRCSNAIRTQRITNNPEYSMYVILIDGDIICFFLGFYRDWAAQQMSEIHIASSHVWELETLLPTIVRGRRTWKPLTPSPASWRIIPERHAHAQVPTTAPDCSRLVLTNSLITVSPVICRTRIFASCESWLAGRQTSYGERISFKLHSRVKH